MTIITAIKNISIAAIGSFIETASQYAPPRSKMPSIPMKMFPFGGFSPRFSLRRSAAVFENLICLIELRSNSRKIAPNTATVITIARGEIENEYFTAPLRILTSASSASFDIAMPINSPTARENSAIISDSHTRIMPIFRLPIPRILYSPNSFFLRFIRNEFV